MYLLRESDRSVGDDLVGSSPRAYRKEAPARPSRRASRWPGPGRVEQGVEFTEEPTERPYGIDCGLRDPFGNRIRFTQPGA